MGESPAERSPVVEWPDELVVAALRRQTAAESVARINDAHQTAKLLLAAGIRRARPDMSESEIEAEVARRLLDAAD